MNKTQNFHPISRNQLEVINSSPIDIYLTCSQTVDSSKTASESISISSSSNVDINATSAIHTEDNGGGDDESISEILEQCIRNAEDVESEFVREEDAEDDSTQGEKISIEGWLLATKWTFFILQQFLCNAVL